MADRYWVGGTASWDGTAGTKWSATSGGAGGASVPTTADDVFFNAASGASVVTIATGNTGARSINCTGFTGTLTGTANITVSGSITLVAGMTCTRTGILTINGTGSITSAGKTLGDNVTIDGTGITVSLADALTLSGTLTVTIGTFTTNNFNVTLANSLVSTGTNTRSINLGSSTVTCSGATAVSFTSTGLTFNADTSSFVLTAQIVTFAGGGLTFYNVSFTYTAQVSSKTITGANVFNNFSVAGPNTAWVTVVNFSNRQTINGTLSTTNTAGDRRVWFRSTTYGIAQVLVVNSAASLTDADFRDIIVIGTAAPISGTRIGNLRGNSGITFSTPKNVYRIGVGNWHDNQWAASSGGAVNTDNFPLAQDTAIIDQSTSAGTITATSNVPYCGSIDMSLRTTALGLSMVAALTLYGNLTLGSGITMTNSATVSFSGRGVQIITSAGRAFSNSIVVDSFSGSVELADALTTSGTLFVDNGTFNSKAFNIAAGAFNASGTFLRTVNFTSSTVTIAGNFTVSNALNLTFIATGSTIAMSNTGPTLTAVGLQFNDVNFTSTSGAFTTTVTGGSNTFNNLTITGPVSGAPRIISFAANQTVTGTFTVTGPSLVRRNFLTSNTIGTRRTITVNSLAANNCDFRDIEIAGVAAGSSPTGAGDCGNNSGLNFPAPKTVYWNLAGNLTWADTGWATSSGGTPDVNNFPLAQDTAVIDNSSADNTSALSTSVFNVGTIDASTRTTAFTLNLATANIYKDLLLGTGITIPSNANALNFAGNTISTITSSGVTLDLPISFIGTGTVQLGGALILGSTRTLTLTQGKFDPGVYNVTAGLFVSNAVNTRELLMGSGLWTLSGTGTVWNINTTNLTYNPQTANILLSDTSTTARTFTGGSLYYNKLTIGGTTGTSTTTISDGNVFGELASTKTVAHTIALGTSAQTFGKWTVTGTAGNVVTLTGTGAAHILAGAATSGIDYLAMGSIGFAATSPGEFYAGVNSTGTAAAPVYRTAKPADSIRYWVGGTGNWSDTARWSASSGGASGASVPRSHDDVVFNSASNATAYIATVDAVTGGIRCKALTVAGPASGLLTLAGSINIVGIHGDVTLPATGLSRTYTGSITLSGSVTGRTFTTNGVALNGTMIVNGVGASWSMSDALNLGGQALSMINGTLSTNNFTLSLALATADTGGLKTLNLGSSTVVFREFSSFIQFGNTATLKNLFTFNAGTSQIDMSVAGGPTLAGNGHTFYNVSIVTTGGGTGLYTIFGANTFNNLTFGSPVADNIHSISLSANQTVNGTFTCTGVTPTRRMFIRSNVLGTTRTITCASLAAASDVDFRDITVTGAAAPISGTRFGDCKGNSGITFPSPKTVYWNLVGGGNWESTAWATSSGGTPNVNNFPLAQDTAIIENTGLNSAATISISTAFNISAINMSNRTTAMTFTASIGFVIYGNLTIGSGVTVSGTSAVTFSGRMTQTLTTANKTITFAITVDSPGGSVVLQDSLTSDANNTWALNMTSGTFDTNSFNVTFTGATSSAVQIPSGNPLPKTIVFGSETWTLSCSGGVWIQQATNFTTAGTRTGTINLISATAKSFTGGGIDYGNITINNGGAGALTITGNNRFKDLTATQTATSAATIALGATVQSLAQFSGSGQAGRLLTITGTSAVTPATLIFTGTGIATNTAVDYLTLIGIRAYPTTDTWYAGNNSITTTSTGTLGWIYASSVAPTAVTSGNFLMFAMP